MRTLDTNEVTNVSGGTLGLLSCLFGKISYKNDCKPAPKPTPKCEPTPPKKPKYC